MRPGAHHRAVDTYPRTTVDAIPFTDLTIDGVPVVDPVGVQYAIVPEYDQPTGWTAAVFVDDRVGFLLNGPLLGRGVFKVFVRKPGSPTSPVIEAGKIRLD
jgi:hypothetical protein